MGGNKTRQAACTVTDLSRLYSHDFDHCGASQPVDVVRASGCAKENYSEQPLATCGRFLPIGSFVSV